MADALVSVALEKITNVLLQQVALFAGATDELEKLKDTFQSIRAILRDAESRQVDEGSVRLWLSKLRKVAYDIDDLLDEWQIASGSLADREGSKDGDDSGNKVCGCFLSPYKGLDHAVSRYRMACRVKEIGERLDQIADEKNKYSFSSSGGSSSLGGDRGALVKSQRLTTSLMDDESEMMIGRENDKETIISRLVGGSSHEGEDGHARVHVVAIVGIGGLGKTTLARQIYHDDRVQDHFKEALYWVYASEDFDVIRLTKEILEEVKGTSTSLSDLNSLQNELLRELRGKRFLLVLDDVWNDDEESWKMLRLSLSSGAHGSRILVTARSEKVANTLNATYTHELKGLSDEQSWVLFSSRAFEGMEDEDCLEFEKVAREIVNKCRGVPLSLKVTGSAMRSKRTVEDWKNVFGSETWSLPQVTDRILPALLLTYCNLPSHLKQCFSYCLMFPNDFKLEKVMLVRLWVAQGFIQPQGNKEAEDIGVEYFDDLVAWSILQQTETSGETRYIIRDLLHDLGEVIAKDEFYTFVNNSNSGKSEQGPSNISNVRHALIFSSSSKPNNIPGALCRAKKLRTLWLNEVDGLDNAIVDLCHQARLLRALVFMGSINSARIVKLPNTIGKMKHLRYLDLSHLHIVGLPESVSNLHNLHTLNLKFCRQLKKLPRDIGGMVSLRHLEIEGTDSLEYLPKGLGRVRCLRSLCKFIVGGGEGGGCRIDELQQLNSLQGSLEIQHLERVSSQEEAQRAQLWRKPYLRRLVLHMSDNDADIERSVSVLEVLRPHSNIEELKLDFNSRSSKLRLPSWIEDSSFLKSTKLEIKGFKE